MPYDRADADWGRQIVDEKAGVTRSAAFAQGHAAGSNPSTLGNLRPRNRNAAPAQTLVPSRPQKTNRLRFLGGR